MRWITTLFVFVLAVASLGAAEAEKSESNGEQKARFDAFAKMLEKTAFVGSFTVDRDQNQNRRAERYEIRRITKLDRGDYWTFFARIAYGDHDVTVPVPVEVKWAGTTPVITVDNLTIPGMGTFDARVVLSDKKYAGTWRHGKVGGLMFGHIEKQTETTEEKEDDGAEGEEEDNEEEEDNLPVWGGNQRRWLPKST